MDLVDGDNDLIYESRRVGLPPSSWTKYHFMQYRMHPSLTPTETYSYNMLSKKYLGEDIVAPIVGLTGVEWFAEGYFDGTSDDLGFPEQKHDYDGIDGWDAMKREILICKAMGFYQVNIFHLNSYNSPGIEKIEELADEWNQPKTIDYPIFGADFKLSRAGFFEPFGNAQYDLMVNVEMYIIRIIGVIAIFLPLFPNLLKFNRIEDRLRSD